MEFTGERVIPGQIEPDLWNEHVARYALAATLARGRRVLDAGCGAGYGTARLAQAARLAVGLDSSAETLAYARRHYSAPNLFFVQGDCLALPFPDKHFDLLVAFEVIEHLSDGEAFLRQMRRLMRPRGLLLLSSPNRRFYSEERGYRNPHHVREFDAAELEAALIPHFPHCRMLAQNHVEALSFADPAQAAAGFWVEAEPATAGGGDEPHFLLALCSSGPLPKPSHFLFLPSTANVLRERELHIRKLEADLARLQEETHRELAERLEWARKLEEELQAKAEFVQELEARVAERDARILERQQTVEKLEGELADRTQWAQRLDAEIARTREVVTRLQQDLEERTRWAKQLDAEVGERDVRILERQQAVEKLETELVERTEWARHLDAELAQARQQLQERTDWAMRLDAELAERTAWAQKLSAEVSTLRTDLQLLLGSLWYRAGKRLRLSPIPEVDKRRPS